MSAGVQWFPGHMATSLRKMRELLAAVDLLVEVVDARVPRSGSNPAWDELAERKSRFCVLSRADLAERIPTADWIAAFRRRGQIAFASDLKRSVQEVKQRLLAALGEKKTARAMVVGIPNSGKSTLINALAKRSAAKAGNRAGVTRATQWIRLSPALELMDTPGILMPKIQTAEGQWKLALTGAIPPERFDAVEILASFHAWAQCRPEFKHIPSLAEFARARGIHKGAGEDLHNAAGAFLKAFGAGKFGRITLERADDTT